MKKYKLKDWVVYALYGLAIVATIGSIYLVNFISKPLEEDEEFKYVDDTIIENEVPVVNVYDTIMRPYVASNVSLTREFYDYLDTESSQVNSLIYYEGTYIPNTGVDYTSDEIFDVVAILEGTVTKITENTLLGKIIEITHENNLIAVYQSLGETNVVEGDSVIRGQVIGQSGIANISKELGNHLHFELVYRGIHLNPEDCYDKKIEEL